MYVTRYCLIISSILFNILSVYPQFTVSGGIGNPYKYTDKLAGTGIEAVYLFNTLDNANIQFESDAGFVRFFKYEYSLKDAEQIPNKDISLIKNASTTQYTISNLEDSRGYYAEVNGAVTSAIWIINYRDHLPVLKSITPSTTGEECEYLKLNIVKEDELLFYSNNGSSNQITRKYQIEYTNLEWNEKSNSFEENNITTDDYDIGIELVIDAPLMSTTFKLSGDQFAQSFGITQHIESSLYTAVATTGHIIAEQTTDSGVTSDIGGSAPANVKFYAVANEPTTYFYTWYIYKQTDEDNPLVRYTDKDISYTFKESGDYTVKLEIADKNSTCVNTITETLSISDFKWEVPNFMLLDGEHEFKISYKSIIEFKGAIYNRWGNEIYTWNDPAKGWDGKYKGKYVSPGVYFYVMTAISGDGKKHKKAGDINILKKK